MLSASASYGSANPGASLAPLNVIGESIDASVFYSKPIFRSRERSLWGTVEFCGLRSDQTLLGYALRNDRIATLTGSLSGTMQAGSGILRGEARVTTGLPLPGVTHQGNARISRSDGDARFVTLSYTAEWTAPLANRVSFVLASEGQVASRPLLATIEIGVGGPNFGRGYDYAERTGDNGILGSGEVRFDLGKFAPHILSRVEVYGAIDGGYVGNLRGSSGGGGLLSTAAGVRAGRGRSSGMIEIALPLNADRFDTGNRDPRLSFRLFAHLLMQAGAAIGQMFGRRVSSWLIVGVAVLTGLLLAILPIGGALDRAISPARFGVVQRTASGNVVIVEMDAQSAVAIKRWPWSRKNYAAVVDNLKNPRSAGGRGDDLFGGESSTWVSQPRLLSETSRKPISTPCIGSLSRPAITGPTRRTFTATPSS